MKKSIDEKLFNITSYIFLTLMSFFCILPFLLVITGSVTNESMIYKHGYQLIPKELSFEAYKVIF